MAERMTSESCRVVRFSRYTSLWSEESAMTINQSNKSISQSGEQHNNDTRSSSKNVFLKTIFYKICQTTLT